MHFILGAFIALVCLTFGILFTEVFPNWLKLALVPIGAVSSGYAIAILIRKIAEWTSAFAQPKLFMTSVYASVAMFIVIVVVKIYLNRRQKA